MDDFLAIWLPGWCFWVMHGWSQTRCLQLLWRNMSTSSKLISHDWISIGHMPCCPQYPNIDIMGIVCLLRYNKIYPEYPMIWIYLKKPFNRENHDYPMVI
jgi:hypothetical protein